MFRRPPLLKPGDKVAILSPSSGLAAVFPLIFQLGLQRLQEVFHLEPVLFPTTLKSPEYLKEHPQMRAQDVNAAFADPDIKAIIANIGGDDQIKIVPFLDPNLISANPKAFLGYSDNTHLHLFLWNLKIISYYGGNLMNQFAMQGAMHDYTLKFLKHVLFEKEGFQAFSSPYRTDIDLDWSDPSNLTKERPLMKSEEWLMHNHEHKKVKARLWGGCLETLFDHLSSKDTFTFSEDLILYLETSEEMPSIDFVYNFMMKLKEKGILERTKGILVAYPKAEFCENVPLEGKVTFIQNQREIIKKALNDLQVSPMIVFNLNFGHTDPQMMIPSGGFATLNGIDKTIHFSYL